MTVISYYLGSNKSLFLIGLLSKACKNVDFTSDLNGRN